jgi:hypothetical protein
MGTQTTQTTQTKQTQQTGASNLEYDIVAEMHELLQGNSALEKYIVDAQNAGDRDAEQCFQQIHDQNRTHVASLRSLLAKQLQRGAATTP